MFPTRLAFVLPLLLSTAIILHAQSSVQYNIADGGALYISTDSPADLTVGYARGQSSASAPSWMTIFDHHSQLALEAELSFPPTALITSGRIYAEAVLPPNSSYVNTGIAIANPNSQSVTVDFYFTDSDGTNFRQGSLTIPANNQFAAFISEDPFRVGRNVFQGTFTFTSTAPVSALAVRGTKNGPGEFMMAALSVADLSRPPMGVQTLAHFTSGGVGSTPDMALWKTEVVLVNPTDALIGGSIEVHAPDGSISSSQSEVGTGVFTIPPRSSIRWELGTTSRLNPVPPFRSGSVRILPASGVAPSVTGIYTYSLVGGFSLSTSGIAALADGTAFRMFVENAGVAGSVGSIQAGLAIANTTATAGTVTVQLSNLDGTPTGMSGSLSIPPYGQTSVFLNQIAGFESLPASIRGVLRVTSTVVVSIIGLRSRFNERSQLLISTVWPIPEGVPAANSEVLIPHFAIGGGYNMKFVLLSDRAASGSILFFDQKGNPISLHFP